MGKTIVHHNNNVPAIVRGVVGGLFVADTIALILTCVFFFGYKHSMRLGGGSDVWVYLS